MDERIKKQMMDLQMRLEQQEQKIGIELEETPKRKNPNHKGTTRKGLKQKRYKKVDWDRFMDHIELMIGQGEKRVSEWASQLKVSFSTARKAGVRLKRRQQAAPDTDITRLLIDPSQAIRVLIPLLDNANPIVVKKAKGWLYKIAEWMDE